MRRFYASRYLDERSGHELLEIHELLLMGSEPQALVTMGIAVLALVANVGGMALLAKHRQNGLHMRASWILTTKEVIANVGVVLAGALVAWTGSSLPDRVVGSAIGLVVIAGAVRILRLGTRPPAAGARATA